MNEGFCVRFLINDATISDIHMSVSSLVDSLDASSLHIAVFFDGKTNFSFDLEKDRLASAGIRIVDEPVKTRYVMDLVAGEVVSRSFFYKSLYAFSVNNCTAVCPEYTIIKSDFNDLHVRNNNNCVAANIPNMIVDVERAEKGMPGITVFAIKDTCSVVKRSKPSFDSGKAPDAIPLVNVGFSVVGLRGADLSTFSRSGRKDKIFRFLKVATRRFCGRSKVMLELRGFVGKLIRIVSTADIEEQAVSVSILMASEIDRLAAIDYSLKGCLSYLPYDNNGGFPNPNSTLSSCQKIVSETTSNKYDYIIVLPWLIAGGVDLCAVNYLNTISRLHPDMKILALTTNNMIHKNLSKEALSLDAKIDLVSLSGSCDDNETSDLNVSTLYSLISMLRPSYLHIMQSKTGYEVLLRYGKQLRSTGLNIIFSSYNYLVDSNGRCFGYTVQELPSVYEPGDIVTTDNTNSKDLWINKYGFRDNDILVHNQLFSAPTIPLRKRNVHDGVRILWAAHVRPEKNPEIVPEIASSLASDNVEIDCYGLFLPINWPDGENPLAANIKNMHYKGAYSDFFNDLNLPEYDIFLYTSKADGTPNVILEAAIAGIPIIASKIGGIPNATREYAYLVEDPQNAEEFITGIREIISHYDTYLEKAKKLQKITISKHDENAFESQIEQMLRRRT